MIRQNFTINFGLSRFFNEIVYRHRKKMYSSIFGSNKIEVNGTILDIGSTSDTGKSSNAFLKFSPSKDIVSVSDQAISKGTCEQFPNVKFIKGDGLNLDFPSNSFSLVFSNAVLEHVGSIRNISRFIMEAHRVSKHDVVLIPPNRWFPLETHTKLLFLHWLPAPIFRKILQLIRLDFFSYQSNLNLLTTKQLNMVLKSSGIQDFRISYLYFLGFPSNIVVRITK